MTDTARKVSRSLYCFTTSIFQVYIFHRYLSSMIDLINYLASIQLVADAPDILIITDLYHYAAQDTVRYHYF